MCALVVFVVFRHLMCSCAVEYMHVLSFVWKREPTIIDLFSVGVEQQRVRKGWRCRKRGAQAIGTRQFNVARQGRSCLHKYTLRFMYCVFSSLSTLMKRTHGIACFNAVIG